MLRLWVKLALAFSLLVGISVGLVSFVVSQSTGREFEVYVQGGGSHYFELAADRLAAYYERSGSWAGVDPVLAGVLRGVNDRLVLADAGGRIVSDTAGQLIGQDASALPAEPQFPITLQGQAVGTLYVLAPGQGQGRGPGFGAGQGRGRGAGAGQGAGAAAGVIQMQSLEERFLAAVNRSVWITALVALAGAMGLSILIARQITGPLAELRRGAHRVAAGDLSGRVRVTSRDEIGDLAVSFNQMADALERNETARRHMVADIAHELRTPLTVIEGTADAILDGVFSATPENLQLIKDQAGTLAKLVSDLRELSLAEAGQLKLEMEPVYMAELVEQAVRGAAPAAQEHGVRLESAVAAGLPAAVVDPARMGQVLTNLVSNAIRHTPSGGDVRIEARQEGDRLVLAVADSGEGIAAEDLPFVFDRFYRADESRARKSGGSGLGLAIVKQLVEAHGGRVWAESEPGRGSRFAVSLPLAPGGSASGRRA